MVVTDASVLIVLAKVRHLNLLKHLYGSVLIGPVVRYEVVDEGRRVGALGVQLVERAMSDGWLQECHLSLRERRFVARLEGGTHLDPGEIEALSLAKHRGTTILVDDKEARLTAQGLGLDFVGTLGVLLEAYRKGHLPHAGLEDAANDVSRVLWLSPGVIAAILRSAREGGR
jgi:predicted nucleic acid-binding protein